MKSRAGVTLIELLIAVSLFSLLSVGILLALRVGLNAMQKANAKLIGNRRVFSVQRILEQQLAGFMPEMADCLVGPEAPAVRMPFFQGEPESMRFVSSYSLGEAARGYPRILEFQVIPREDNQGVRLVVNERLYTGPRGAGLFCLGRTADPLSGASIPRFRAIEIGPSSFVLADRLAYCRFSYREPAPPPQPERWVAVWTAMRWPTAVRVEMAPLEADSTRLQLMALTAPIRVNKMPLNWYGYTD
jgi:prepilin-type N-terminal cleavage/methylation domain-containing protein